MRPGDLARFLKPPFTAQWQEIGQVIGDARIGELLLKLPTLTTLNLLFCRPGTAHLDFLSQLPLLTALCLKCYFIPADAIFSSLVLCSCITDLNLLGGFKSVHWSALFAKLRIKKLTIRQDTLETLRCFAEGPITQSLEELSLECLSLPPSEVSHLYALRRLRTLRLGGCFSARLADATVDSLIPPSPLLPVLTKLFYFWSPANGRWESVERRGPSFEWMQQRMTQ